MVGLIITWLVTSISFLIISKLLIGGEIDSFGKAPISAVVFGVLNAILRPVLGFLTFVFIVLTFGLFLFILNALVFGLVAAIIPRVRLRYGFWSALIGARCLRYATRSPSAHC